MRQAIYEAAILDNSDGGSDIDVTMASSSASLMQTCRQVKIEAEPIRYQRPQSFSSQAKLFAWIDRSQPSNLERVRTLCLHLTDVDVSPLLQQAVGVPARFSNAWTIYNHELAKLDEVLRALPNLTNLTILPPKQRHAMSVKFYRMFLQIIPSRCLKLKRLEIHDTKDVLHYAPMLKDIQEIIFTKVAQENADSRASNREPIEASPAIKIEADDLEARRHRSSPTPRSMRRSRVTRVVSD